MAISIIDMFSIGIGPSSSHTMGPMCAAHCFVDIVTKKYNLSKIHRIKTEFFDSLGHTGQGHGSDKAVILGLSGEKPEEVESEDIPAKLQDVKNTGTLKLAGIQSIRFSIKKDIIFHHKESLSKHPNGMKFSAYNEKNKLLLSKIYYSVGGGFITSDDEYQQFTVPTENTDQPYPFTTGKELLHHCNVSGLSISTLMLANESVWRSETETRNYLLKIWQTMQECIDRGCRTEGILPGGLNLKRRAAHLFRRLKTEEKSNHDPLKVMDWVDLYALAINEENAAGGKVVTAPTNGAAGIIPAVLYYFQQFKDNCDDDAIVRFLLTAGAIGILFKENASISGAEVGCQGEVGVACSMAAAGLAEVLGATVEQCENAAEIGMEHNLGLTCDPVAGLVQIPCIERNAMAAVTAINAARLALRGDGSHIVTLDKVIRTMRETGADMNVQYKETARGGLAVNIVAC